MKPIDLRSDRLRIRQFHERDSEDCIRFRAQVFNIQEPRQQALNWLQWTIDSYRELAQLGQPPYADYAVEARSNGHFIGSVGIVPTIIPWGALGGDAADTLLSPEVGLFWGIMPRYRRRGFASEAGTALLDYLFRELSIARVVATTENNNIASQRTMERLGMSLRRNPLPQPAWRQVVGVIKHPRRR
ncbi:MAG: GNAT family N-acetyltransferase [Chloroflexota bacterium]|nr:GNAT family N-acetyltransferase [Chloroflexota bacterium]